MTQSTVAITRNSPPRFPKSRAETSNFNHSRSSRQQRKGPMRSFTPRSNRCKLLRRTERHVSTCMFMAASWPPWHHTLTGSRFEESKRRPYGYTRTMLCWENLRTGAADIVRGTLTSAETAFLPASHEDGITLRIWYGPVVGRKLGPTLTNLRFASWSAEHF